MLCTYVDDNFILWSYCILFYYETSWGTDFMMLRSFIWNLMNHRCCGADVIYFDFSSEKENRTLFQMCGRLYFSTSLFRVGLLTLIYSASFMAPAILCPSLPIILKLSSVVVSPVVFWCSKIGDGVFIMKPHEAQILWCWGHLFETSWITDVVVLMSFILILVLRRKTEPCSKCVADCTCQHLYSG